MLKARVVQHRQEREERTVAAQNRELRQKVKELERTVARQQKIIDKLHQQHPEATQEPAATLPPPGQPPAPPAATARQDGPPAAPTTGCCAEPAPKIYFLAGRKYRICGNCQTRARVG